MTLSHYVAIGGNLPIASMQPIDVVTSAIKELATCGFEIEGVSALYRTPAFPAGSGPDFVNAAISLSSPLYPAQILEKLHEIEAIFGRQRVQRWGGRTLDLDLIASGEIVSPDLPTWRQWYELSPDQQQSSAPSELILPHPRLQDRSFVLLPMRDIAPDWRHPVLGRTVSEMCADLAESDRDSVLKLADPPCV